MLRCGPGGLLARVGPECPNKMTESGSMTEILSANFGTQVKRAIK
jgi:hypothetical protein